MASENKAQTSAPTKRAPPPALNPENCALVQPWKDFVSKGMITNLSVGFTPMGVTIKCRVNPSLSREGDDPAGIPIGDAKQRIIDAGLWSPRAQKTGNVKKEELLPKKSLVKKDFEKGSIDKLSARVAAVAAALGDTTARGRIGSLKLMHEGVDTFDKWWSGANPAQKARLLSDNKHFKEFSDDDCKILARQIPGSPFRGSVPTPTPEEEDEETGGQPIASPTRQSGKSTPQK